MKSVIKLANKLAGKQVASLVAIIAITLFVYGCTTVVPRQVETISISYDNGERNGGFIGWKTNLNVSYGVITPHARDRYNALIKVYGKRRLPPLAEDEGISSYGVNYLITLEGLSDFARMNRWHKNDLALPK